MSHVEHHRGEVKQIEAELMRKMIALGLGWHDREAMMKLASECKVFFPADAQAAYASHDRRLIIKAELFALASLMIHTMERAALDEHEGHGGEVWKAFSKHLYT